MGGYRKNRVKRRRQRVVLTGILMDASLLMKQTKGQVLISVEKRSQKVKSIHSKSLYFLEKSETKIIRNWIGQGFK